MPRLVWNGCWMVSSIRVAYTLLLLLASPLFAEEHEEAVQTGLEAELQLLEDVQAGLALAVAACGEEPHCVTALDEKEMQHLQEDLDALLAGSDLSVDHPLFERYQALVENHQNLQQTIARVNEDIDRDALEGVWADQFVIDEIVVGPRVPYPNEDVPLSRFEDLNQPLPIQ